MRFWTYWGPDDVGPATVVPDTYSDGRGNFTVALAPDLAILLPGMQSPHFRQLNTIENRIGVICGLHVDMTGEQGKLVWSLVGDHMSVAVDVREHSPTRGKWVSAHLTASGREQFWVPPGFAHGVVCLSAFGLMQYASTTPYRPDVERGLSPLAIDMPWPDATDFSTLRAADLRVNSIDQMWEEWYEENSGGVPAP